MDKCLETFQNVIQITSTFSTFKNKSLSMLITSWKLLEKYLEKQMVQTTVGVQSGELMLE